MQKFGVTLTAKLRHADLWKAAKKLGSNAALARELDMQASELGNWINLKRVPSERTGKKVEKKLFDLTGKTLDELFPKELRENAEFLQHAKSIEVTRQIEVKMLGCQAAERLLLPGADEDAIRNLDNEELRRRLNATLKTLSYREREIIKLRYLGSMDQSEVAGVFGITSSRVSQLERAALRKMADVNRGPSLVGFLENAENEEPREIPLTEKDWEEYRQFLNRRFRRTVCIDVEPAEIEPPEGE